MNAPNKEAMELETWTETGKASLGEVHASKRAQDNLIDDALVYGLEQAKALSSLAFSAGS